MNLYNFDSRAAAAAAAAAAGEVVSGELTARGKIKIMKFIIVSLGVGGLGECWAATPG